jgi:hypothetical protein
MPMPGFGQTSEDVVVIMRVIATGGAVTAVARVMTAEEVAPEGRGALIVRVLLLLLPGACLRTLASAIGAPRQGIDWRAHA